MRPINKRNAYKNIGKRNILNKSIKERMKDEDARQILKLKRNKSQMKNFMHFPKANFIKKQFNSFNTERISSGKQVLMRKGMITVTSEQQPSSHSNEVTGSEKLVFVDKNGITVTKRNHVPAPKSSPINHLCQTENELSCVDEEDLEKMTLDDLPEASKLKTIRSNIQDSCRPLQSWSSPSVSSRMQNYTDSTNSFNILVTNLQREVSKTDIVELFSDLGAIADVQMIQYGTALVTYVNKEEAILACETYHNRLLDGQPMQCTLLPPVASSSSFIKSSGRFSNRLSPMIYTPLKNNASTSRFSSPLQVSRTSSMTNNTPGRPVNFTVRMP